MIQLALKIPVNYLIPFSKMTHFDYAQLPLIMQSDAYANFYRDQSKRDRIVMLSTEGEVDSKKIFEGARRVKAQEILINSKVSIFDQGSLIIQLSKRFNKKIICVISSSSFGAWLMYYKHFKRYKELKSIGVPSQIDFEVPNEVNIKSKTRLYMERRIKLFEYLVTNDLISKKTFHLCEAGDCIEYAHLRKYPFIKSASTASPILHGINGIAYTESGLPCESLDCELDYNAKLKINQIKDIIRNINIVRDYCIN